MKYTLLFAALSLILVSCSKNPQEYFGQAALNCNLLYGFAGAGMQRELAEPSVKLVDEKTYVTAPMTRMEVVAQKLATIEQNFNTLQSLPANKDADDMLKASKALYEWVLPVYRNEYQALAKLYDGGAAADAIAAMEKKIQSQYESRFLQLYDNVWVVSKAYAERNGIRVQEVNPSPTKRQ